jgi:hypothetical protein
MRHQQVWRRRDETDWREVLEVIFAVIFLDVV